MMTLCFLQILETIQLPSDYGFKRIPLYLLALIPSVLGSIVKVLVYQPNSQLDLIL